jgi:polyisoprenoid-binding protein YceI
MTLHHALRRTFPVATLLMAATTCAALTAAAISAAPTTQTAPLAMDTARVTIAGTSNIHNYTAWTDTVRVTKVALRAPIAPEALWSEIVKPGALEAFEVAIPAATLTSPKAGLDKNMHKALKVEANRDITFRLARIERSATGALMAVGVLRIATVEREVVLALKTERRDAALVVMGELALLMTDYGIKPPVAMLGMLKTDPKVTVTFETVLSVPRT